MLCFVETYGPTLAAGPGTLARLGVAHTMLSVEDDAGIERVLAERKTKLVYFESPTNPVTRIADIARITKAAHAAGALTVMDNTFAGFHNHGQYGVDLFVHSLTKYASGHGDVMGGAVIARADTARPIRREARAARHVARPARRLPRHARHEDVLPALRGPGGLGAARLRAFLAAHPAVERVHYPGLPDHPRHALARAQMREFGSHRRIRPCARRRGSAAIRGRARILRDHAEPRLG